MYYDIEIASTSGVKMYYDIEIPSTSEVKMYDDIEIPSDLPKTTSLESSQGLLVKNLFKQIGENCGSPLTMPSLMFKKIIPKSPN